MKKKIIGKKLSLKKIRKNEDDYLENIMKTIVTKTSSEIIKKNADDYQDYWRL